MSTSGTVLNSLSSLPPATIRQYRIICCLFIASLTAFIYDWVLSISEEYGIVLKLGASRPNMIYFLSRIASLGFLVTTIFFSVVSVENCQALEQAIGIFVSVSMLSTSFLFLLRVRAVYCNSRPITLLFVSFWLVMLAFLIADVTLLRAEHIPYIPGCINTTKHNFIAVPTIISCINDTLVFLAISYRLAGNALVPEDTFRNRIRSFFKGHGLYSLSRSILQSGQIYYLATIAFFFVNLSVVVSPAAPDGLQYILTPLYSAFTNSMACRVFRGVALGTIEDSTLSTTRIAGAFGSTLHEPVPL